jgi:hypothetical protein
MAFLRKRGWAVGLAIGLLVGLVLGGLWPDTPLHGTSTDRSNNYAMATGYVDEGVEAVYFLDFLTGTIRAAVLSNSTNRFQAHYAGNINADLATVIAGSNATMAQTNAARRRAGLPPMPQLQMPQSPSYLMVTGAIDMRRAGGMATQYPLSALYVAETNTGIVLAYLIPWDRNAHLADRDAADMLRLWTGDQFAAALIQTE